MAHVTFIHGIANKPARDELLDLWRVALLDNGGVDLDEAGVSMSLVYWADMLYPEPLPQAYALESSESDLGQTAPEQAADLAWLPELPLDEQAFVVALGLKTGLDPRSPGAPEQADVVTGSPLEAVPLPGFLKKRLMKIWLRDVHHYLYDVTFSPRPGESYQLRRDIRRRTVDALRQGQPTGPRVVVAHSLGTVIAYDVLTALDEAPPIDALITLGSPLGLSEIQQALSPPWTAVDGWPARSLGSGRWWNVSDRLDPVCGVDPMIAGEFCRAGLPLVNDVIVNNRGAWRHSVVEYLGQKALREMLRDAVGAELF
jgi:hypothetical protein